MSGADIPYQLRPNKFIDRQMFLDLLARLITPRGPENYIYVSMGGRHLVDHHAVYKRLGLEALCSFDRNANEVKRQKFNRPNGKAVCLEFSSEDLPNKIDELFSKTYKRKTNLIVWLDYTDIDWKTQLQEAVQTMIRLQHGDVFKITLNACADKRLFDVSKYKEAGASGPLAYRATILRDKVGIFLPSSIKSIPDDGLPAALVRCIEMAALEAERLAPSLKFQPVLITSYRDGLPMITATCAVIGLDAVDTFPPPAYKKWPFYCKGWSDIKKIFAPVLSTKEQLRLNGHLHDGPKKMLRSLKFMPAASADKALQAMKSYRDFQRYYPTFRNVEE